PNGSSWSGERMFRISTRNSAFGLGRQSRLKPSRKNGFAPLMAFGPNEFPTLTLMLNGRPNWYESRVTWSALVMPEEEPTLTVDERWSRDGSNHEAARARPEIGTSGVKPAAPGSPKPVGCGLVNPACAGDAASSATRAATAVKPGMIRIAGRRNVGDMATSSTSRLGSRARTVNGLSPRAPGGAGS